MTNQNKNKMAIEDLIIGHFDGTLNDQQEQQLARALTDSSEAQQHFLTQMRMEGRLHSLGRDGFLREPDVKTAIQREQATTLSPAFEPAAEKGHDRKRLFAISSLAACAAVVMMLALSAIWPSSVNASNVILKAQRAAAELVDRTYRITLSNSAAESTPRELTINLRGGGRFLMRPMDGAFAMGCDGTEYWATQPGRPLWIANDPRSLARRLKSNFPNMWLLGIATSPNEPLLLEMGGLLTLVERRHDVQLMDSSSPAEHYVRATLKRNRRNLNSIAPQTIDLWADVRTGVVRRAEVKWQDGKQMQFELLESKQLSDEWYDHSQHAPDSEVRRFPN